MIAEQKLAQKRLTLLQLAEKLGNVSKAFPKPCLKTSKTG